MLIVCSDAAVPGQLVVTARRAHGPASQVVGHSELPIRQPMLQLERSIQATQYPEIAYCMTISYSLGFGNGYFIFFLARDENAPSDIKKDNDSDCAAGYRAILRL